jgi:hypothetical protein
LLVEVSMFVQWAERGLSQIKNELETFPQGLETLTVFWGHNTSSYSDLGSFYCRVVSPKTLV